MKKEDAEMFALEGSGVSVTATAKDGKEYVHYYPDSTPTELIVTDSTTASGIEIVREEEKAQMVEAVDIAKTNRPYVSEVEMSFNLTDGFKIKIKREPSKIVRWFRR